MLTSAWGIDDDAPPAPPPTVEPPGRWDGAAMAAEEEVAGGCNVLSLGGRAPCDHHDVTRNISGQSMSTDLLIYPQ